MPTLAQRIFVTLTLADVAVDRHPDAARDSRTGLLERGALTETATSIALDPKMPKPNQLTLMRLDGLKKVAETLSEEQSNRLFEEIGAVLQARSLGGDSAARLDAEVFGLVEAGAPNGTQLVADLKDATRSAGISADLITPIIAMIDLSVGKLSDDDVRRSLAYAIKRSLGHESFRAGKTTLKEELAEACKEAVKAVAMIRGRIERQEIALAYQPVFTLPDLTPHHYEALARERDGLSAFETIRLGEEVGLIAEIDLMILRLGLKQISDRPGPAIAINISGQSIQQEGFRREMMALLNGSHALHERLLFELTETQAVTNVEEVAAFLKTLRVRGHAVCLDDFGAGAADYGYLRNFEVDFVKIDGPLLQAAASNKRDYAMVASIVSLCRELGAATIGEMIETKEHVKTALALGIGYGQGWLFGKALTDLPDNGIGAAHAVKRTGTHDSWG